MIAVDEDRAATRGFDQLSERVLTVAGIYGPNASGKSTVLEALAWLSFAGRTSLHSWYRFVPRFPHRFGDGPDRPSTFEADFEVDGVRHGYRLEVGDSAVLYEPESTVLVGWGWLWRWLGRVGWFGGSVLGRLGPF